ncbi:MAG: zinc-binding alcohol dehydrogenase family protein [Flavobacteriaceae bacterium]
MKYIVCQKPGLWSEGEKESPTPKPNEALVQIKKIGVCGTDLHAFKGNQAFFNYPRILGHELAGVVIEPPKDKTPLKKGDRVAILPYMNCSQCDACHAGKTNCCEKLQVLGVHVDGGMQEQMALPHTHLIPLNTLSLEAIALIEPLSIGAHALRRAAPQAGQTIVVMGCGPIGVGIMQLAKNRGLRVIALDQDEERLNFVKTHLDVEGILAGVKAEDAIKSLTQDKRADMVFDATGNQKAMENGHHFMKHGGTYVLVGLYKDSLSFKHPEIHSKETTLLCSRNATKEDFDWVIDTLQKDNFPVNRYITHQMDFKNVATAFETLYNSNKLLMKAIISL